MKKKLIDLEVEFDTHRNHPLKFEQLTPGRRKPVIWTCVKCGYSWPARVHNRLKGTECPRCRGTIPIPGETDLATIFPRVASEWDYSENEKGPETYLPYSNERISWICAEGHRWEEKINNRTVNGLDCPYCGGSRPIPGVNDLGTLFPWLAEQWNQKKNGGLKPSDVFPQSNKRVSWICGRGHEWETKIYHRTDGTNCPYCSGTKPIVGETDLETLEPEIARQWHRIKNNGHMPSEFTCFSHFGAMWLCDNGHEYPMPIYRRSRGCGCSVCDGKRIVPGVNDLATLAPNLSKEWHDEKNKGVKPTQISLHSHDKYYWLCSHCGHFWRASPNNRAAGKGCPKCAGHVVDPEVNSFAAINPHLINQWDLEKNKPLTAWDVAAYDNRDYYWICENGHSFPANPANRTKGTRCPYCTGKRPVIGVNDFATLCPNAAAEWHPSKNEGKCPEQFLPNSHENIAWLCKEGHVFHKKIYERTCGSKCPYCEKRLPVVGETDLGTLHPELVERWDNAKNERTPELYFSDSTASVHWICKEGHSFRAPIREMVLRWRCHHCEQKRTAPWNK